MQIITFLGVEIFFGVVQEFDGCHHGAVAVPLAVVVVDQKEKYKTRPCILYMQGIRTGGHTDKRGYHWRDDLTSTAIMNT